MLKLLLVEDQADKRDTIKGFLSEKYEGDVKISDKSSLRGALKEIIENQDYDMILLDMSMPNFDPLEGDYSDSSPESFAGKELLEQMMLREIKIPVIVITQFSSFEGGTVSLDSLRKEFDELYSDFYLGSVYFNSSVDTWKNDLLNMMRNYND